METIVLRLFAKTLQIGYFCLQHGLKIRNIFPHNPLDLKPLRTYALKYANFIAKLQDGHKAC